MKLSPAHGYRAKNSVGNMSPFWRLHRAHANTTLPGTCAPPCDSGYTWSRVAKSNSSGAAQYTHRRPQSRIAARLIAPFCCAEEICLARRWTRGTRGRETRWNCRRRDNVTSLKRQHPAPGTCPVAGCRADQQRTGYSGDQALVALSWSLSDPRRSTFFSMSGKTAHWPPVGRASFGRAPYKCNRGLHRARGDFAFLRLRAGIRKRLVEQFAMRTFIHPPPIGTAFHRRRRRRLRRS